MAIRIVTSVVAIVLVLTPFVQATTYDYVIAGAGTSGLLLAVALTTNADVTVAVLEAGGDDRSDPRITVPEREGSIAGTAYDWNFTTVPQIGLNGHQTVSLSRGKVLGGTSAMNWMINMRASSAEFDAWESVLGNAGWNWSTIDAAAKASEHFTAPLANVSAIPGLSYDSANHGFSGVIASTMAKDLFSLYPDYLIPALKALGVLTPSDRDGGSTTGASSVPLAINASSYTRSYSATAFNAAQNRPNLHVITHAQVTRILWNGKKANGLATATGLAYLNTSSSAGVNAQEATITARNVILSAGPIQTPQLLELSGVGDPATLQPLNIATTVKLPAVGTKLTDHPTFAGIFSFNISGFTGGEYAQNFLDYAQPSRFLSVSDHAALAAALKPVKPPSGSNIAPSSWSMWRHLVAADEPFIEFGWYNQFCTAYLLHPLSAGTVHITSSNPLAKPSINPAYNTASLNLTLDGKLTSLSIDLWMLAKAVQYYATTLPKSAPFARIGAEYATISSASNFTIFQGRVFDGISSGAHLTGGATMLPKANRGVVDLNLRVYGTSNVRVVDSSVIPFSPGQHPAGLAYAIAMKAAEILMNA